MFTRQVKVQIGNSISIYKIQRKSEDSGGKSTPFYPFFPDRPRLFHLSAEHGRN